jgi:predicted amidohydrolase
MGMLKVALLQMTPCGDDQAANQRKGEAFCRQAKAMGADIALFPEMWSNGYTFPDPVEPGSPERWKAQAVDAHAPFVAHFTALAVELDMAIALTYAKVYTCDFDVESMLTPGDDFYVCALDTASGDVQIGAMICYDREFPESARILMLKGAEIILTPNACDLELHRIGQFRARADENMVGVAMANYAGPRDKGHSIAFHPIAYATEDGPSRDTLIVEAGEQEGIFLAEFNVDAIRDYRARETWGNSYRKPRCYGLLASLDVQKPFIRADSRR